MTIHDPRPNFTIYPMPSEAETDMGITSHEREAVLSLVIPETGQSAVKNSTDGPQAFNLAVTKATFGMKGNDKWDHAGHFNRAKAVVLAMIASGEIEPIYNDIYAIVGVKLPNPNDDETDGPIGETDPRLTLFVKTLGDLAAASQMLGAEQDYHRAADEMLDPTLAENASLLSRAEQAERRVAELEARPEPEHLNTRIAELEAELARERAALTAVEIKARNLGEMLEVERSEHGRTKEALKGARATVSEQGDILQGISRALGADKLSRNKIPAVIKEASDRFKTEAGQETYDSMMDALFIFGFEQASRIIERFFTSDDEEAVRARDLVQRLNETNTEMEQLPKNSTRKFNSLADKHNALFDELSVLVNKWLGSKPQQIT